MKKEINASTRSTAIFILLIAMLFFESCKKTVEPTVSETGNETTDRKPRNPPPPPPPPPFYFGTCWNPNVQGTFVAGSPASVTVTLTYVNSPGGPHSGFTSATVNGITFTAPPGTLTTGTGSIVFTASGTPVNAGLFTVGLSIGSSSACPFTFPALNPPVSGPTTDPGPVIGSTGIVNFIYKGQSVAYKTVRAGDGKIWLQQNLGSPQVAFGSLDRASYGDYFQWGRWDDGHQAANSQTITGGPSLLNPFHIAAGNPNFIKGTTTSTKWWGTGGSATDTWNGTTATSSNGKDPCAVLGIGWRLPTAADWQNVMNFEDLEGTGAAYQSRLKLPAAGYRLMHDGLVFQNGDNGHYWSKTSATSNTAKVLVFDDNTYDAELGNSERGQGYPCRCVKD